MKKKLLVTMAAAMLLLGAACGGDDDGGDEGNGESGGGGTVALTAAEFAFDPADLTAAAGDTIEFTNEDDVEHNFTSEEAGIDEDVDASGSTSISLEGLEAGTYDYICEYHPDQMTGTLTIE